MGFGWLMVGYLFANIPLSFAKLLGYPLMIMALWRLAPYHSRFRYAFYSSFASLPFALYFSLSAFSQLGFLDLTFLNGTVYNVVQWCYFAFSLFFHVKHRLIEKKVLLPCILPELACVFLGAWLARCFGSEILRKLFSGFVVAVGVREAIGAFRKPKKETGNPLPADKTDGEKQK